MEEVAILEGLSERSGLMVKKGNECMDRLRDVRGRLDIIINGPHPTADLQCKETEIYPDSNLGRICRNVDVTSANIDDEIGVISGIMSLLNRLRRTPASA